MESEAEGWGRRGWIVRQGPGGVESEAGGWRVRQWVESEAKGVESEILIEGGRRVGQSGDGE